MTKSRSVLVVDDEVDCREFVDAVVEKIGDLQVLTATNGEDALAVARKCLPDLVIMDVMMPRKDGYTAFCELRKDPATAEIPVIMLTGVSELDGYLDGNADSPRPQLFVAKPIDPQRLEEMIRHVLKLA